MTTEQKKKVADETPALDLSQTLLVEPEGGMFEAYSNLINLDWTLHDVRIRFGELTQQPREGKPGTWKDQEIVIQEVAAIRLPWHQAKNLSLLLAQLVSKYEEINGELKQLKLINL